MTDRTIQDEARALLALADEIWEWKDAAGSPDAMVLRRWSGIVRDASRRIASTSECPRCAEKDAEIERLRFWNEEYLNQLKKAGDNMAHDYKPLIRVEDLERGDIVRHKYLPGITYIVDDAHGARATAVRTVDITNPSEWQMYRPDEEVDVYSFLAMRTGLPRQTVKERLLKALLW